MSVRHDRNLHLIFAVTLMAVLGVSSIAPVLPAIGRALEISPRRIGLLITAFTVPGVVLTPLLGVLADRYGRKRILVPSLLLFGLAGAACALAPSFELLLGLRFLQGMGAAALGSLNVTLIGDLYRGPDRAAAMGFNSGVLSIGTAIYPLLGGGLALLGWRYPFLLALLSLPVGLLVLCKLQNPEPRLRQTLREYLGDVWHNVIQWRVVCLFTICMLTFVLLFGSFLTFFPLLLDERFGAGPAMIGAILTCSSITSGFTSALLGRLTRRHGAANLIRFSFVCYAVSLASIPLLPGPIMLILPSLLFGVAMGLNLPSLLTLLTGLAPTERRAAFMSLNGMVLRLGQTVGPLLMGVAYELGGMQAPFIGGAGLALLILLLAVVTVKNTGEGEK